MNEILIVKCLSDNYAYIYSNKNGDAFVVDPSEAGPVIDVLNKHKLNLKFILPTTTQFPLICFFSPVSGSVSFTLNSPWFSLAI